jgi:hypothetical protein
MRHAANIRHLDPADRILVVAVESFSARAETKDGSREPANLIVMETTKKDTDALLKRLIEPQAFRQGVKVLTYRQAPLEIRSSAGR